ncbi:MAG: glutaredoxin 3 [Polyangiaceae bacterium]
MSPTSNPPVEVTIYTTQVCPYCHAAKRLLERRGIAFVEVDVTADEARRAWLREVTGRPTVPQIFFGSEAVGGFDDLAALDRSGQLAPNHGTSEAALGPLASHGVSQ